MSVCARCGCEVYPDEIDCGFCPIYLSVGQLAAQIHAFIKSQRYEYVIAVEENQIVIKPKDAPL